QAVRKHTVRGCGSVTADLLSPFFLQAVDGIRDRNVTGVQTCALPIYLHHSQWMWLLSSAGLVLMYFLVQMMNVIFQMANHKGSCLVLHLASLFPFLYRNQIFSSNLKKHHLPFFPTLILMLLRLMIFGTLHRNQLFPNLYLGYGH